MSMLRLSTVTAVVLAYAASQAIAQQMSARISSPRAQVGESLSLSVTLKNVPRGTTPTIPRTKDFRIKLPNPNPKFRGERQHVCSMVVIPSVEEEDLRRSHRERDRLVRERTAHINRIKGLLFGQGIRGINVMKDYKTLAPAELVTGDGRPLPKRLGREITREIQRLALVQEQLVEVERERDLAPTPCEATERKRHELLRLKGIGPTFSAVLSREVYYRHFANRRQVANYIGLAPSPYDSGDSRRSQGISKAGNSLARHTMIQAAWLWIRHQPNSALTQWFRRRTEGESKRMRCVMIVALARKLAIALWRYVELGLIPEGATLSAK